MESYYNMSQLFIAVVLGGECSVLRFCTPVLIRKVAVRSALSHGSTTEVAEGDMGEISTMKSDHCNLHHFTENAYIGESGLLPLYLSTTQFKIQEIFGLFKKGFIQNLSSSVCLSDLHYSFIKSHLYNMS